MNRLGMALLALAGLAVAPGVATAGDRAGGASAPAAPEGRPVVRLDQLDVSRAPLSASREDAIRELLAREARRADWGAGRTARIEYRVRIDELVAELKGDVLRVRCSATGFLPRGRSARSHLTFGGAPAEREQLIDHVLAIVSRGVITRLADLERRRRGYKR